MLATGKQKERFVAGRTAAVIPAIPPPLRKSQPISFSLVMRQMNDVGTNRIATVAFLQDSSRRGECATLATDVPTPRAAIAAMTQKDDLDSMVTQVSSRSRFGKFWDRLFSHNTPRLTRDLWLLILFALMRLQVPVCVARNEFDNTA